MKLFKKLYLFLPLLLWACSEDSGDDGGSVQPTQLSISDVQVDEGNGAQTVTFTVTLSGNNPGNVSVDYRTVDGSAEAGVDYEGVTNGQLTFAANENQKDIVINLLGDNEFEQDETFSILLSNPVNAVLQNDRGVATLINDDAQGSSFQIPTTGYTTPTSYDGLDLVWADEFQTATLSDDWTHEIGNGCPSLCGWGNNELEYYQPENTSLVDGEYLVIEAREETVENNNYTSSRIITQGKQSFQYGRVDIRAVLPKGKGIWPALWMLGDNIDQVGWPSCGEIDIMEIIGSEPSTVHGTVHWDDNGNNANFGGSTTLPSGDFSDEFHVFSIIWDSQKIVWLLNDVQYHEIDITPAELSEFRNSFFFIFNVAVGGNWPGNPDASTVFPQRMIVDYIRIFQ